MLRQFHASVRARLNTSEYIRHFKPVRPGIVPSDLDMALDQDKWLTVIEGKSCTTDEVAKIKDASDLAKWWFNRDKLSVGQRLLLDTLSERGIITAVSMNAYALRDGYSVGSEKVPGGKTRHFVEGPTNGEYFCHPYRHTVLGYILTIPNKKLYQNAVDFFDAASRKLDLEVIKAEGHCRLLVKLWKHADELDLEDFDSSEGASLLLNYNSHLVKEYGSFYCGRFFK